RVEGRSCVRERHGRVGRPEQGRGCYRHMRIRPGKGGLADALQFLLQVQGHVSARADAVDVDPARVSEHLDYLDERADIEVADRVGYGSGVSMPDLPGDCGGLIARENVVRRL